MNDELNKRLLEGFDKAQEYVKAGGDFVAEQAPLVVQEVLRWGLSSHIFWALLCVGFCVAIPLVYRWGYNFCKRHDAVDEMMVAVTFILSSIGEIIFTISCLYHLYMIVYILVAPRLYILETLAAIINQGRR